MLQLIEGGAKTGKSTRIRQDLLALADREEISSGELLLLVPEQFSYETERAYYHALGIRRADRVQVLSFKRLSDEVFREYGGLAGETAGDPAKLLAMKLALQDCKGELRLYAPLVKRPDLPGQMLKAMSELKHAAISLEMLEEAAKKAEGFLKDKLSDLALLRRTYEALLGAHYTDEEDDLSRAEEQIRAHRWFAGKKVWLDGFKSFTAAQERILFLMLEQGADVTAALSLSEGDPRFSTTEQTALRLRALAHKAGVPTPAPIRLTEAAGFSDPSLQWFVKEALKNAPKPYTEENTGVICCEMLNEFDEASFAAARILELVRGKEYAFEETAVLVRDMDRYAPLLEAAFDRYGIPYYMDRTESIASMPLVRFIQHAAGALTAGFDRAEVLSFLKCGMTDLSLEELDAFESYSLVWNIDREGFFTPFTQNPAGFADREMTEGEKAELSKAESVRELCVSLLSAFRKEGEEGSWPRAVLKLLTDLSLPERLSRQILSLQRQGRQQEAEDQKRTWSSVMDLLDVMERMLAGQPMTIREFRDSFSVCVAGCSLGRIPQTLDSVQIGGADRIRVTGKKAVILLGANEGEFPLLSSEDGLFTDRERKTLAGLGLEIAGNLEERILEERFISWQALSCPTKQLTLVRSLGDLAGKMRYPSALISSFREIFPNSPVLHPNDLPPDYFCRTEKTLFLQYARSFTEKTPFAASAEALLFKDGWGGKVQKLKETGSSRRFSLTDPVLARKLFGKELRVSPTQIDVFFSCRFQYFCRYGLHLKPRKRAELNALSRGDIVHFLLERVLSGEYGDFRNLSDPELSALLEQLLSDYLDQALGGGKEKGPTFLYYYRRMRDAALRIFKALRAEFSQTKFVIAGLEEKVEPNARILPLTVPVDEETSVVVTGKIDRVDLFREADACYARIVDYKTGKKAFDLSDIAQGLNLQMLLYLFALWKNGREEYANVTPAGILYMPAHEPAPALPRNAGEEEVEAASEKGYTMNGLLLDNQDVLCAMEPDLAGRFLPVSLSRTSKSESLKGNYLAAAEDFQNLELYTEGLLRSMADQLLSGEIEPDPYRNGDKRPCNYCDFRAVCGHESKDAFRSIPKADLSDIAAACDAAKEEEA